MTRPNQHIGKRIRRSVLAFLFFLFLPMSVAQAGPGHDHAHGDSHATAHHGEGHHGPEAINWVGMNYKEGPDKEDKYPPLLFALINFGLFVFLLAFFAGKPLQRYFAGRHNKVKNELAEAATIRKEAQDKLAEIDKRLAGLDREIETLRQDVLRDAEEEKKRILAQAEVDAQYIVEMADKTLALEIRKVKTQLEREAIDIAIQAAESILKQQVSTDDVTRLNKEFLQQISAEARVSN